MSDSGILVSTSEFGVSTITLNKPDKRNAFDAELIQELLHAIKKLRDDAKTKILIFAAKGDHFCAGADLAWMQKMSKSSAEENRHDSAQLALLLHELYTFPKPSIAAVQGVSFGGGLGIIACCDIAIAASNAGFCFSEVKIGLTPSAISPYVVAAIGERHARYYFLTAEKFDAHIAQVMGLIHQVVPQDQLAATVENCASLLLRNSPHALSEAKKLIAKVSHQSISADLMRFTSDHLAMMRESSEGKEGLQAFLEKRAAKW